jgi:hypothetical protein
MHQRKNLSGNAQQRQGQFSMYSEFIFVSHSTHFAVHSSLTAGEDSCDVEAVLYNLRPNIHIDSADAFLVGAPERLPLDISDPSMRVSQVLTTAFLS